MDEQKLKTVIAKNIMSYRKTENITQAELGQLLNYSDKAVSKWERAESMPDVFVLQKIAEIFRLTVNDLLEEHEEAKIKPAVVIVKRRVIIPLLAAGLVWLIATIINVFFNLFELFPGLTWRVFIYAIPVTFIVLIVFSSLWWRPYLTAGFISGLIWTVALTIFLSVPMNNAYLFFVIPIPLQIMIVLWYVMKLRPDMLKRKKK
ncbi:MAG: helix-turn-helix transcriptional regulator [Clostridiales bacterium]|jgi:transcriptional regulator with XRE-family HTH domain|nr:helix-turn-helix transcriptional regulator [Clostridiales bacterium]